MQNKDKKISIFCKLKELFEKDICKKGKALRRNNIGEYVSNEFKILCASKGI